MSKESKLVEKELELSACDIETQKYHMSMMISLLMPFILSFASVGIAVSDTNLKILFIALSLVLLFLLASFLFADSSKLREKYRLRKQLIINKYS